MAKYLDENGVTTLWGNIKTYFPGVATKSGNTVSPNSGVSAGNIATFAVDANNYVTLQGITTASLASTHSHTLSIATDTGTSQLTMAANTKYKLTAGGSTYIFTTPPNPSHQDWGIVAAGSQGTSNASSQSDPYINLVRGSTPTFDSGVQLKGSNNVSISAASGVITISGLANTVTGSSLTNNQIILGSGSSGVQASGKTITTSAPSGANGEANTVPTSSAVWSAISSATAGLTGAMHFVGITTTALTDGATTATLAGSGLTKTTGFVAGDVVIYDNKEFVWSGSAWEILGDEGSYALKTVTITGTGALGGGGAISSNQTITHNTSGVTAQVYGPTADVSGANSIAIPKITVDQYGHITAATTYTYTGTAGAKDGRMTISANGGTAVNTLYTANASSATNAINFVQGTGITTAVAAYSGTTPATVTITHADPGTGSEMTTTNGTAAAASAGTTYAVVTGVTISKDSKGHITGVSTTRQNVVSNQTVNNATLSLQGSASGDSATSTGFSANGSTNTTLKFAVSGSAVTSVSTTAASSGVATITINSASSLKNPNSIKIGTKPSSNGTATDIITYDGSAAKALYFSTADASNTNVKFAIDSNGFVTGTVTEANTAQLKVSDTSNKRISTTESSAKYIQFTGGTSKFTVSDGTNSFDVAVGNDMTAITESEINTTCVL